MATSGEAPPEAQLIRVRREREGLSRYDVARRAGKGVSEPTVRRYESDAPGVRRESRTVARIAAVLGITQEELTAAGRDDAAYDLGRLMQDTAARPDVAAALAQIGGPAGGDGWTRLMTEILQGFADIDGEPLPDGVRQGLREELLVGLAHDAAERRRQLLAIHRISRNG